MLDVNYCDKYEAGGDAQAFELLGEGVAEELMNDVCERMGVIEYLEEALLVADSQQEKGIQYDVGKGLIIEGLAVVAMTEQSSNVDPACGMPQIYL